MYYIIQPFNEIVFLIHEILLFPSLFLTTKAFIIRKQLQIPNSLINTLKLSFLRNHFLFFNDIYRYKVEYFLYVGTKSYCFDSNLLSKSSFQCSNVFGTRILTVINEESVIRITKTCFAS